MTWGMIISGVIGAGASLYGSKQAGKEASKLKKQQQPLIDQQMANLKMLQPYGQSLTGAGKENIDIVQAYLRKLASGDRTLTMQTMAPELNTMARQNMGSVSAARNLFPRGGAGAAATAEQPFQFQGNVNNALFGARPRAMEQLAQLGGNQSSLGLAAMGQGSGLTNNMLNYGLQAQGQMFNQGAQIGQGISSVVGPFMQWYMMNRPGGQTNGQNLAPNPVTNNMGYNTGMGFHSGSNASQAPWGMGGAQFGWGTNPSYGSYSPSSNPYSGKST